MLEIVNLMFVTLGYGIYEEGDIAAESLPDFFDSMVGVLYYVVEQCRTHNARVLLPHLSHDNHRNCERVEDVGKSAFSFLGSVGLFGQFISIFYESVASLIVGAEIGRDSKRASLASATILA